MDSFRSDRRHRHMLGFAACHGHWQTLIILSDSIKHACDSMARLPNTLGKRQSKDSSFKVVEDALSV